MVASRKSMSSVESLNYNGAISITPSDSTDLPKDVGGLWCGTGGDVSVVMVDGTSVIFRNVTTLAPVWIRRVKATGTTALNIVGVY